MVDVGGGVEGLPENGFDGGNVADHENSAPLVAFLESFSGDGDSLVGLDEGFPAGCGEGGVEKPPGVQFRVGRIGLGEGEAIPLPEVEFHQARVGGHRQVEQVGNSLGGLLAAGQRGGDDDGGDVVGSGDAVGGAAGLPLPQFGQRRVG